MTDITIGELADSLASELCGEYAPEKPSVSQAADILAKAFREIENAAYERAALIADSRILSCDDLTSWDDDFRLGHSGAAEDISADIRALKHGKNDGRRTL